jgi:hypothetical protein
MWVSGLGRRRAVSRRRRQVEAETGEFCGGSRPAEQEALYFAKQPYDGKEAQLFDGLDALRR